jgi:hypothetical protein
MVFQLCGEYPAVLILRDSPSPPTVIRSSDNDRSDLATGTHDVETVSVHEEARPELSIKVSQMFPGFTSITRAEDAGLSGLLFGGAGSEEIM